MRERQLRRTLLPDYAIFAAILFFRLTRRAVAVIISLSDWYINAILQVNK